jgi:hypothetical protein
METKANNRLKTTEQAFISRVSQPATDQENRYE